MLRPFLLTLLIFSAPFTSHAEEVIQGQAQVAPSRLPLEELRTFAEIFERIRASYVEEVDDKTLLENAIHGMLGGLDPHSSYMGPDDFNDLAPAASLGAWVLKWVWKTALLRWLAPSTILLPRRRAFRPAT